MGFMSKVKRNLHLMLQRPPRQQYAALCYRMKKKQGLLEVLVATSRDTGRWVIPKGWPMTDKKAHQVAEREAYEEVGVKGKVEKEPLGHYHYRKTLDNGLKIPVVVQVHALEVDECLKSFPEKGSRKIEWVSCEEAATRVHEPELKILFLQFAEKMEPLLAGAQTKVVG
ncbi:NTP pyrophosphohydrolase [Neorhizobium sp. SOG26]|uniref:NUDIX hydrolase n=1 Tax=Neorhizobium sp. SOG26 TaxID=2060726 RepID=UPI000E57EAC1|nr:NUDIX hydrolase [Neorhizobium sp. SOG26]AXV14518.1 NTP pyrophosphohydrolase [Neorhizobium sp. SOG26]